MKLDESGRKHVIVAEHSLDPAPPDAVLIPPSSLAAYLATQHMGMRLYIIGTETFIWDMFEIATQAGLGEGEIHLTPTEGTTRRVYCAHCKTIAEHGLQTRISCPGCGLPLAVHAQFSRRLKAHLGVMVMENETN